MNVAKEQEQEHHRQKVHTHTNTYSKRDLFKYFKWHLSCIL